MATKLQKDEASVSQKPMCGIVMPISEIDGCTETHWLEVKEILSESIIQAGFEPNLVSNADDVGVIQKRIIQNLYDNPIVVVDVSGKNSNVMFELGMRLAFDKPTIIIKDDRTQYSFDTAPVEHLEYPRDLRFSKIVEFKERLTEKIINTHKKASSDPDFSTFLKHFGSFKVAKIETEVVPKEDFILEEIKNLREIVLRSQRSIKSDSLIFDDSKINPHKEAVDIGAVFEDKSYEEIKDLASFISEMGWVRAVTITNTTTENAYHLRVSMKANSLTHKSRIKQALWERGAQIVSIT